MAYMYVCPECRSYFKAKSSGKNIKCPKCSHQYLIDLFMDHEAWGTLTLVEKKTIANARISEETADEPAEPVKEPVSTEAKPVTKKVVKKVVKKRVVKKVVVKKAAESSGEVKEAEVKAPSEPEKKPAGEEVKASSEPVKKAVEEVSALAPSVEEENKASSGSGNILASILKGIKDKEKGPEKEEKEDTEDKKEARTEEGTQPDEKEEEGGNKSEEHVPQRPPINKKYVLIVAATTAALFLYLLTVTFIIPTFRIKNELPYLRIADVGDTVRFGKYKGQDDWVVLDKKGSNLLCISNYPIYGHPYYDEGWENSNLRKWLNSKYINSSFNVFERMRIKSTGDIQQEYPGYSRNLGTDVPDNVFIINENELLNYLKKHKDAIMNINDGEIRAVCWIEIN